MATTTEKKALDAKLINALITATEDVLKTMANTEVKVKEVTPSNNYKANGDISAVIGIMGDGGEGMVCLSFPLQLATLIVSRLVGASPDSISSDDRCDGIGELVNMLSGNAKTILSKESGSTYKLSLPSIILGAQHEISTRPKNCPYLVIRFEVEGKEFTLQVSFKFN